MKYLRILFFVAYSSLIFYSCRNEDDAMQDRNALVAVQFTSTLGGSVQSQTKASGATWSSGDRIGIFMKRPNQSLSSGNIIDGIDNIDYTTTGNGRFSVVNTSETIFYPTDNNPVDFIAYYPYTAILSDYVYKIDVADQSNQEAIDLLYSNNSKGQTQNNITSELSFTHQLTRITFTITKGEGISDLSSLNITFSGLATKAEFNLADGNLVADDSSISTFEAKVTTDGTSAEAIIIPSDITTGRTIKFSLGTISVFTWNIPATTKFEKGKKYNYNITLRNSGGNIEPVNGWVETPLFEESSTLTYITHRIDSKIRNYSMLYDKTNRVALWVAYPLHRYYIEKKTERTDEWAYDPLLGESDQPDLFKTWPSYPVYNRGHQIASGDRLVSRSANAATFYFSNMTLQQSDFNGGIWNALETKVQTWAKNISDTLYVVTGVILSTKDNPIIKYGDDNSSPVRKSAIPQYFYKVLAKKSGNAYYTIGYRMPNVKPASGDNFNNYRVTVSTLEKETGFTFFPDIGQTARNTIVDSQWN
ncbi:MAG: fimbrillin family protein [Prevotella sp.]|jgi:endonuclease G|nr:fimbrillin family protein [Prevotella sp.]